MVTLYNKGTLIKHWLTLVKNVIITSLSDRLYIIQQVISVIK